MTGSVPAPLVAVAVSGGRDSLCLLHATLRAAAPLGVAVLALHVHHGLMAEADDWAARFGRRCRRIAGAGLALQHEVLRLDGAPAPGESVEAWARRGRYEALARAASGAGATLVLLAHHRRDQAETVLLQALRGAGPAGLAAMPAIASRQGLEWARPWLDLDPSLIDAYAARHGLARAAVDDPSNRDERFARSRLRHAVLPALREAFPQAEAALAAVARQAGEARAALEELAAIDLAALRADAAPAEAAEAAEVAGGAGSAIAFAPWRTLSAARRANALRAWLGAQGGGPVPDTLVRRVLDEWQGGSGAAWPFGPDRWLRAWRDRLLVADAPPVEAPTALAPAGSCRTSTLCITGPGLLVVPGWSGALRVVASEAPGLPATPDGLQLQVRPRAGGERFCLAPRGTARALRKQWQAAGVPAWSREGPLLWRGDLLVFAPGLGVDARSWGAPGKPRWQLSWHPRGIAGGRGSLDSPVLD